MVAAALDHDGDQAGGVIRNHAAREPGVEAAWRQQAPRVQRSTSTGASLGTRAQRRSAGAGRGQEQKRHCVAPDENRMRELLRAKRGTPSPLSSMPLRGAGSGSSPRAHGRCLVPTLTWLPHGLPWSPCMPHAHARVAGRMWRTCSPPAIAAVARRRTCVYSTRPAAEGRERGGAYGTAHTVQACYLKTKKGRASQGQRFVCECSAPHTQSTLEQAADICQGERPSKSGESTGLALERPRRRGEHVRAVVRGSGLAKSVSAAAVSCKLSLTGDGEI